MSEVLKRKLVSIRKVDSISPIIFTNKETGLEETANAIELATIGGWTCIVKTGSFKPNDLATYFEIDSFLPIEPRYEFLRKSSYKKFADDNEGYRIKSMKMKGVLSQGLLLPLSDFPEIKNPTEGDDVTQLLKIDKYETDPFNKTVNKHYTWYQKIWNKFRYRYFYKWFPSLNPDPTLPFPSDIISKTDEDRIQNMKWILEKCKGSKFIAKEKLDGSSITIIWKDNKLRVCSRNFELVKKDPDFWKTVNDIKYEEKLISISKKTGLKNIALQGELVGKPQGNPYKLLMNNIFLFNIKNLDTGKYITDSQMLLNFAESGFIFCPAVWSGDLDFDIENILKFADGKSLLNDKVLREGLVFRNEDHSISFKVISNEFLLNQK